MKFLIGTLTFLVSISTIYCGDHWALIVAGSRGYYNYRHQADVCHAYHVLHNHGIPDERMVVMMYDDIAYNIENPYQGNIINHPNGSNVYEGVLKDYTKQDVTPEVFLSVLTGDAEKVRNLTGREGKVIKSKPNDRVFVYFADHGGPGIIAFPEGFLYAKELHKTLKKMHKRRQYKQMVLYIEACESGSMFQNILEDDIDVFATTAADPDHSSYACYYDNKRETYLGDVYSVNWLEDSDREDLKLETLRDQYRLVKKETNTSLVMEFGDLSIAALKVADFQGNSTAKGNSLRFSPSRKNKPFKGAVPSEDVEEEILKKRIQKAKGFEVTRHKAALQALLQRKEETIEYFKNIVSLASKPHLFEIFLTSPLQLKDHECYRQSVELIEKICPGIKLQQVRIIFYIAVVLWLLCSFSNSVFLLITIL